MLRRLCSSTSEVRSQSSALTCFYSICDEVLLTAFSLRLHIGNNGASVIFLAI